MIQSVSRYVNATLTVREDNTVSVSRNFPDNPYSFPVAYYRWKESDRIDRLAAAVGLKPHEWWKIMDINPMILDPNDIRPGQQIRVPRRV